VPSTLEFMQVSVERPVWASQIRGCCVGIAALDQPTGSD
jgi:hypothetical protein